ncbi:MAG: DsbA family protein [Chloroflexus sp.]|nr:DsbA family protein [Chloroflexus sp.]
MHQRWIVLSILIWLIGCTAAAPVPPPPTIPRLPTVTPEPILKVTPTSRIIQLAENPIPTFTATPVPTAVISTAGVITAAMAQLGLSAEPYAILGDPDALITIVEFTDFGCSFCRRHHQFTFRHLVDEFVTSGQVFYVVKQFPVTSPQGELAALAAICAGEQGAYWTMHDALFAAGDVWYGDVVNARRQIMTIAAELGLDRAELQDCIARPSTQEVIARHVSEAHELHIFGTPVFFINNQLLAGAQPIERWREFLQLAANSYLR